MHTNFSWLLLLIPCFAFIVNVNSEKAKEPPTGTNRASWADQRSVKLYNELKGKLSGVVGDFGWMNPSGKVIQPGTPCSEAVGVGRNTGTGDATTEAGAAPPPPPPAPTGGGGGGDPCLNATVAVHYYMEDEHKKPFIISDLTNALQCSGSGSKPECVCAESEASAQEVDGVKLCLRKDLAKGDECIHSAECVDDLVCVFDAKNPIVDAEDTGDIEDFRRYCGRSSALLPTIVLLISLIFCTTVFVN